MEMGLARYNLTQAEASIVLLVHNLRPSRKEPFIDTVGERFDIENRSFLVVGKGWEYKEYIGLPNIPSKMWDGACLKHEAYIVFMYMIDAGGWR